MRTLILATFLSILSLCSYPEKLAEMPELEKHLKISIGEDKIYISDGNAYKVRIYSKKDYKYIKSFGRKGEGPGEFPSPPWNIYIKKDHLVILNRDFMRFTFDGKLINQKKLPLRSARIVKDSFVHTKLIHPVKLTKFGNPHASVNVCNNKMGKDSEIYKIVLSRLIMARIKQWDILKAQQDYGVTGDKIVISDPSKGFFFKIFDHQGTPLKDIDIQYKKIAVSETVKKERLRVLKNEFGKRWNSFRKRFKFFWPEYVPPYERVQIHDDKIYAFTFKTRGDSMELITLDLKGNILGKTFVPIDSQYRCTVKDGVYYYLHEGEDVWELHSLKTF